MSHQIARQLTRWVLFAHRRGKLVFTLLVVTTVIAGFWGARLFKLDSDTGKLIRPSADTRWHAQNEAYKAAFPHGRDTALIVLSGESLVEVNNATDALAHELRQSDWYHDVAVPGREPFFTEHLLYELDTDQLAGLSGQLQDLLPLLQGLEQNPGLAGLLGMLQYQLGQDLAAGSLSQGTRLLLAKLDRALATPGEPVSWLEKESGSGQTLYQMIILQGRQQFGESTPSTALIRATREYLAQVSADFPGVGMRLTGEIAMADEELRTALQGIQFAGLASLVLLALILTFGVRCWSIVIGIFVMLAAGVVWTTLYALLAVGSFNTLSMVFLVMFFGLGVDFALHFCLRVQESLSLDHERGQPLVAASSDIGTALLLCTLTSGIAFLSFFPTEYRGLADLGVISAGGMLIAFILTLTLMPAWFALVGMPRPWQASAPGRLHFGLDRLSPPVVLVTALLLALGAAWFAKDARFDYSVLAMRDKNSESMATLLELQQQQLATNYSVSILAAPEEAAALAERLRALPTVAEVKTPASHIAAQQVEKQALLAPLAGIGELEFKDPEPTSLAEFEQAASGLKKLLSSAVAMDLNGQDESQAERISEELASVTTEQAVEQLQADLVVPLLQDARELRPKVLAQPYTLQDLPGETRARFIAPDGRHLLEVLPVAQLDSLEAMDDFVGQVEAIAPNIAGRTVVERGIGQAVVRSFRTAIGIALVGICVVLLLYFREPLTPTLILVPLGLTTLLTFAIIEMTGLTLNMANILVVPLIFGLGVDTSIHVAHRYHEAKDVSEVLQSSTPRAITLSALTTIGTFFSISFSPHKGAASIGLILTVAIGLMMVVTFMVLPALLSQFEPKDRRRGSR
jgi:hypothetical protein